MESENESSTFIKRWLLKANGRKGGKSKKGKRGW